MNRKGVTPVVATALLLTIAVGAVVSAAVFLDNTLGDVEDSFGDQVSEEAKEEKAEMEIVYGYETNGFLLIDIRNTGEIPLKIEEDSGQRLLSVYTNTGPVNNWKYVSSTYQNQSGIIIGKSRIFSINTTVDYPADQEAKEIEIQGPYGTSSGINCFNDGSSRC